MLDFQVVYVRDRVPLRNAEAMTMLKILARTPKRAEELSTVTSIAVDGKSASFFRAGDGSLLTSLPEGLYFTTTGLLAVSQPGVPVTVKVFRETLNQDGVSVLEAETIRASDLQIDNTSMRVLGPDLRDAVEVLVNGTKVGFVVVDKTALICQIPSGTDTVTSVEVFSSSSAVSESSSFAYLLGSYPSSVSGMNKLVQQFIKLMWTSQGSDTFNPSMGGNLLKFVGSVTDQDGGSALVKVVTDIQRLAATLTARQIEQGLPQEEILAQAQLLDFRVATDDPTSVELQIQLSTLSGLIAVVKSSVGNPMAAAQSAAKQLLGV